MNYNEAKELALKMKVDNAWLYEYPETGDCDIYLGESCREELIKEGWIPRAHITLEPKIVEMFTGVIPSE